jgi:hypothetical protein
MAAIPEKPLEELIHELPPDLRQQVRDFVEFLLEKRRPESPNCARTGQELWKSTGRRKL